METLTTKCDSCGGKGKDVHKRQDMWYTIYRMGRNDGLPLKLDICPKCGKTGFYRVKGRRAYACASCGYQVYPTTNTIFHKSSTNLTDWFFAIYLKSQSRHKISAKELQRHLGCTYKTAWRINKKIESLD